MASPTGDSYVCPPGGVIAGGRYRFAGKRIIVAGDSLTDSGQSWGGGGYLWGLALARSPVLVSRNAGIAGNNIGQLTGRWAADVAAYSPAAVMTRIGTNDVESGSTTTITAFSAAYQPIIDWHLTNGIPGIIHAIPPESGTPGAAIVARNDWLAAQCAAHSSLLKFANDSTDLGDAGYAYQSQYYADGTHLNGYGRRKQGERMAPILSALFGNAECRLLDPTDNTLTNPASNQHVKNPHMAGTSGTVGAGFTGTAPTAWSLSRSGGGTAQCSIVAADPGDPVQVPWLRVTPQTAAAGEQFTVSSLLQHPAYDTTLSSLTRLDLTAEVRFNSLDASKFTQLNSGVVDGAYVPSDWHILYMGYPQTLNEAVIVRQGLPRDNVFWSDVAHAANSLTVKFLLTASASGFTSSPGSFDIRCVSVRGLQD